MQTGDFYSKFPRKKINSKERESKLNFKQFLHLKVKISLLQAMEAHKVARG
jgi:hypothetical protein